MTDKYDEAIEAHTTEAEIEDALYTAWVEMGGPEKLSVEHEALALASLEEVVKPMGWRVMEIERVTKEIGDEVRVIQATVRHGYNARVIQWNTFNKGWMVHLNGGGWIKFSAGEV